MAKKATVMKKTIPGAKAKPAKTKIAVRAVVSGKTGGRSGSRDFDASDAVVNLLQSPLVADLVAVAATAALAALAEQGFAGGKDGRSRAGSAVKAAGKAAAAAVGRRLGTELDEIRQKSKR